MKRYLHALPYLLGLMTVGFTSCNKQIEQVPSAEVLPEVEILSETDIPRDEALENLASVLTSWCGSELRSGDPAYQTHSRMLNELRTYDLRKVRTVRSGGALRSKEYDSSGDRPASTQLMHLVNFDEGGYAVVSADRRIPSAVLAVVDEGTIREEDFEAADSVYTEADIREQYPDFKMYNDTVGDFYAMTTSRNVINHDLYQFAASYARCDDRGVIDEPWDEDRDRHSNHRENPYMAAPGYDCNHPTNPEPSLPDTYTTKEWEMEKEVPMMIRTLWDQDAPFNNLTPERRKFWLVGPKKHAPAGCGPVAVAQILTYMDHTRYTFNGRKIDYDLLRGFCTIDNRSTSKRAAADMAAYFLAALGKSLETIYTYGFGMTLPYKVKKHFEHQGFSNVKRSYNPGERKTEVLASLDRGCPVFITSGSCITSFHCWVIDGYRKEKEITRTIARATGETISSRETGDALYVHCNFGWRGTCNGYYTYDVFDTRAGAKEFDEDEEKYIKEIAAAKRTRNYHILTNVITFDR